MEMERTNRKLARLDLVKKRAAARTRRRIDLIREEQDLRAAEAQEAAEAKAAPKPSIRTKDAVKAAEERNAHMEADVDSEVGLDSDGKPVPSTDKASTAKKGDK